MYRTDIIITAITSNDTSMNITVDQTQEEKKCKIENVEEPPEQTESLFGTPLNITPASFVEEYVPVFVRRPAITDFPMQQSEDEGEKTTEREERTDNGPDSRDTETQGTNEDSQRNQTYQTSSRDLSLDGEQLEMMDTAMPRLACDLPSTPPRPPFHYNIYDNTLPKKYTRTTTIIQQNRSKKIINQREKKHFLL
jgi:hypothetical protein